MKKEKVVFCWSGGKDSALALHRILQSGKYEVVSLLTTLNKEYKRVSMHGVREELVDWQARSIGVPLDKVYIEEGTNEEYERIMKEKLLYYKLRSVNKVVFGDIFLEDLKKYREDNLKKVGMEAVFPLWKEDTKELIKEFLALGFKTMICCVNHQFLNKNFLGKKIDAKFVFKLPEKVDPCGENGEYHSFCFAGPIFKQIVDIKRGEIVQRSFPVYIDNKEESVIFSYCDLYI